MAARLKIYHWHDGRISQIVAAPNMKVAADYFRTSLYDMRRYGGEADSDAAQIALTQPGLVFKRKMFGEGPFEPSPPVPSR